MVTLINLVYWETLLLLLGLLFLILSSLLTGGINTRGLFQGTKGDGTKYFSPERVQLLLFTLGAAFQYVSAVLRDPTVFPVVDSTWIALLGGSHAVYLGGKFGALFAGKK